LYAASNSNCTIPSWTKHGTGGTLIHQCMQRPVQAVRPPSSLLLSNIPTNSQNWQTGDESVHNPLGLSGSFYVFLPSTCYSATYSVRTRRSPLCRYGTVATNHLEHHLTSRWVILSSSKSIGRMSMQPCRLLRSTVRGAVHTWDEVAVDLTGPWRFTIAQQTCAFRALTCIDLFTTFNEIISIDDATSWHVATKFKTGWLSRPLCNLICHQPIHQHVPWFPCIQPQHVPSYSVHC